MQISTAVDIEMEEVAKRLASRDAAPASEAARKAAVLKEELEAAKKAAAEFAGKQAKVRGLGGRRGVHEVRA